MIAWFCTAVSSVKIYKDRPNLHRPYKIPGGIKMAYIATVFSGIFLLLMIIPGTPISMGKVEYILFVSWLVIGFVIYAIYSKGDILIETKILKENEGGYVE